MPSGLIPFLTPFQALLCVEVKGVLMPQRAKGGASCSPSIFPGWNNRIYLREGKDQPRFVLFLRENPRRMWLPALKHQGNKKIVRKTLQTHVEHLLLRKQILTLLIARQRGGKVEEERICTQVVFDSVCQGPDQSGETVSVPLPSSDLNVPDWFPQQREVM